MNYNSIPRKPMKSVLQMIVQDKATEVRWLNTLSFLEYIGSRKIAKTACLTHPTFEVMEHYADEARHAFAFKHLSSLLSIKETTETLCQEDGLAYFQNLDQQLTRWITDLTGQEDTYQNYLMVTTMVEKRAMQLYPLYKSLTPHPEVKEELHKIILEEANHRVAIEDSALRILKKHGVDNFDEGVAIETRLFNQFIEAVGQFVESPE
jgi:hypothetical protein